MSGYCLKSAIYSRKGKHTAKKRFKTKGSHGSNARLLLEAAPLPFILCW